MVVLDVYQEAISLFLGKGMSFYNDAGSFTDTFCSIIISYLLLSRLVSLYQHWSCSLLCNIMILTSTGGVTEYPSKDVMELNLVF